MKSFLRWLDRKLRDSRRGEVVNAIAIRDDASVSISRPYISSRNSLSFRVINAVGGSIVEVNRVEDTNQYHDERTTLYIIPEDVDFQTELGKIITLEHMK